MREMRKYRLGRRKKAEPIHLPFMQYGTLEVGGRMTLDKDQDSAMVKCLLLLEWLEMN